MGQWPSDVDSIHFDIGVFGVGKFTKNLGPLPIPGERALDDDVFLAENAQSSNLVGPHHGFEANEPGDFAGRQCVSVRESLC